MCGKHKSVSCPNCEMHKVLTLLHELQCKQWLDEITRKPKLRTYVTFKNYYEVESYAL